MKTLLVLGIFGLIAATIFYFFIGKSKPKTQSGPIVFFGDSLTAGVGAGPGEDFPTLVAKELNVPVANAGVSGDTTGLALARIYRDVINKNPSIVVVELGGNDYLNRVDVEETKSNFREIVGGVSKTHAKIVIVTTRTGLLTDPYEDFLRDLAKKYDAVFVQSILKGAISDKSLMADEIHPNAAGYKVIAERLIKVLRPLVK